MDKNITYYHELEQGTDEWLRVRLGILTASQVNEIVTNKGAIKKGKKEGTPNKAVTKFANKLTAQRINKRPEPYFESYHTARGHFEEEIARDIYIEQIEQVEQCGFITRQFDGFVIGCSPDGLVGEDSGIEIKSRIGEFQVETVLSKEVPEEYMNQIQTFLLVSGRDKCNYVQYSNGMPLFVKLVKPDIGRQTVILEAAAALEEQIKNALGVMGIASQSMIKCDYVPFELEGEIDSEEGE